MKDDSIVISRAGVVRTGVSADADPITTEVVRHALNSAANQMKRALVRTASSSPSGAACKARACSAALRERTKRPATK